MVVGGDLVLESECLVNSIGCRNLFLIPDEVLVFNSDVQIVSEFLFGTAT